MNKANSAIFHQTLKAYAKIHTRMMFKGEKCRSVQEQRASVAQTFLFPHRKSL